MPVCVFTALDFPVILGGNVLVFVIQTVDLNDLNYVFCTRHTSLHVESFLRSLMTLNLDTT
jgi:hypothetical protein